MTSWNVGDTVYKRGTDTVLWKVVDSYRSGSGLQFVVQSPDGTHSTAFLPRQLDLLGTPFVHHASTAPESQPMSELVEENIATYGGFEQETSTSITPIPIPVLPIGIQGAIDAGQTYDLNQFGAGGSLAGTPFIHGYSPTIAAQETGLPLPITTAGAAASGVVRQLTTAVSSISAPVIELPNLPQLPQMPNVIDIIVDAAKTSLGPLGSTLVDQVTPSPTPTESTAITTQPNLVGGLILVGGLYFLTRGK